MLEDTLLLASSEATPRPLLPPATFSDSPSTSSSATSDELVGRNRRPHPHHPHPLQQLRVQAQVRGGGSGDGDSSVSSGDMMTVGVGQWVTTYEGQHYESVALPIELLHESQNRAAFAGN